MPTYQYACTNCGEQLEAVQKFSDEPLTECPACGGRLRKVFSAVGVVFKGSGFYKTDSRSTGKKSGGSAKSDDKSSTETGSGSGSGKESSTSGDTATGGTSTSSDPGSSSGSSSSTSSSSSSGQVA